uniref:Uncharacterized protein n=1 Tax=Romanomermis culicivorax TaxID=13658 RepID=A0A915KK76_ROMCU
MNGYNKFSESSIQSVLKSVPFNKKKTCKNKYYVTTLLADPFESEAFYKFTAYTNYYTRRTNFLRKVVHTAKLDCTLRDKYRLIENYSDVNGCLVEKKHRVVEFIRHVKEY